MESKIVFGKMVDYFRKKNNLTMEELGDRLGKTKSTISRWVSGERYPKIEEVEQIAIFFDTDVNTLVFGANQLKPTTLSLINDTCAKLTEKRQKNVLNYAEQELAEQNIRANITSLEDYKANKANLNTAIAEFKKEPEVNIEIAAMVSAGYGIANYCKERILKIVTMKDSDVPSSYDLAFEISGDSMSPFYEDGDVVFVRYDSNVYNRSIMVVEINGEAFLKKLFLEDDQLRLTSLNDDIDENGNPLYPDFYAGEDDEIYIIGKVVN